MKNLLTITAAILFACSANAKIVYLNNNLSEANIDENLYITWTDAYAACSPGDTIYVTGSNVGHGSITITKPLNIIGPGYFLDQNLETQVNKKSVVFSSITFSAGSENSFISGLTITNTNSYVNIHSGINDITIENCYLTYIYFNNGSGTVNNNIQIKKCYFWKTNSNISRNVNNDGICTNLLVSNNIFNGGIIIPTGSTGIFTQNLCRHNTLSLGTTSSFEVSNNIYLNQNSNNFYIQPLPDASVHHNISITGVFGSENDNFTAPEGSLFIGDANASTDGQYQLGNGSPAKGAGSGGVDIGPFGGPDPYRLSGLPDLPNIYELSTGGFVTGESLPVRIKVKQ